MVGLDIGRIPTLYFLGYNVLGRSMDLTAPGGRLFPYARVSWTRAAAAWRYKLLTGAGSYLGCRRTTGRGAAGACAAAVVAP